MTIDHVMVRRSFLYAFTGRAVFYITAAEAFYFLSGLVLGIVTCRQPLPRSVRRVLRRALELYAASIAVSLFFALLAALTPLRLWFDLEESLPRGTQLVTFILEFFTLRNAFHGAEFLVLYVLLLLASPLALCLLSRGWDAAFLSLVFGLYALAQLAPQVVRLPFDTIFFPAAWQVLFFAGLWLGWRREAIQEWVRRAIVARPVLRIAVIAILTAAGIGFAWLHLSGYQAWPELPALLGSREQQLNPLRLSLAGLYLLDFYLLVSWLWQPLRRTLGWLLLPLGQNSLWSFCVHLLAVVVVINFPGYTRNGNRLEGALFQALAVALVWGSLWLRLWLIARRPRPRLLGSPV